jgi:hypothetical protein
MARIYHPDTTDDFKYIWIHKQFTNKFQYEGAFLIPVQTRDERTSVAFGISTRAVKYTAKNERTMYLGEGFTHDTSRRFRWVRHMNSPGAANYNKIKNKTEEVNWFQKRRMAL